MPARLIIADGPLAGGELWIEDTAVRLGRDSGCELQLDDPTLDAHALTIRYADKRYTVFNRGAATLQLDTLVVAPGESGVWRSGTSLFFAGGTVLTLETSGDGAPARRAAKPVAAPSLLSAAVADDALLSAPTAEAAAAADEAKKQADNKAAIVALVFVLAAVGIILSDLYAVAPTAGGKPIPTFAELMPRLKATPEIAPDLWVRLSETYASAYRGDAAAAKREYRLLRDRIDWEKNSLLSQGKPVPDALADAEAFVKTKL